MQQRLFRTNSAGRLEFNANALTLFKIFQESNLFKPAEENDALFIAFANLNGHATFYYESASEKKKLENESKNENQVIHSARYNLLLDKDSNIRYEFEFLTINHVNKKAISSTSARGISYKDIRDPIIKAFHEEKLAPLLEKTPVCKK